MLQIYKVFIKNFYILIIDCTNTNNLKTFTSSLTFLNSKFLKNQHNIKKVSSISLLMDYLNNLSYNLKSNLFVSCKNAHVHFYNFKKNFSFIIAAGGIVLNERGEVLMIYKNNIWDLPKGKKDNFESDVETAIREVNEETNVKVQYVKENSFSTYHMYSLDQVPSQNNMILKETRWFLMHASSQDQLKPQFDESIKYVSWFHKNQLKNLNIHNSLKSVFSHFMN